ncbi:MAG: hypothetical protein JRG95_00655 [Deltaproteobacteria bacterium]|nr:hypothetical protein [Deltaproteobacteria bacterium]
MSNRRIRKRTEEQPKLWAVVLLVALALGASVGAIQKSQVPPPVVPEALQGRWTTREPSHSDRYIEIGPTTIAHGTGGLLGTIRAVRQVTQLPPGRRGYIRFEVEIMDDEGIIASTVELDYRDGIVPTLALPNVAGYWRRERS